MQKIPTMFRRDDRGFVTPRLNPLGAAAAAGGWTPRRKYDGHAMWFDPAGGWWARKRVDAGSAVPESFVPTGTTDLGSHYGWVPVRGSGFMFRQEFEAALAVCGGMSTGTYELVGPDIGEGSHPGTEYELIMHRKAQVIDLPQGRLEFMPLADFMVRVLWPERIEGIVWHGANGRMVKLKCGDFRPSLIQDLARRAEQP